MGVDRFGQEYSFNGWSKGNEPMSKHNHKRREFMVGPERPRDELCPRCKIQLSKQLAWSFVRCKMICENCGFTVDCSD